ncbi:MAG: DNA polymerase I [Dehalococcoidia bacterium]|nr:DNA polymerase I [Dehalococcoidia bacterium]
MATAQPRLLLFDGYALVHRAYHALPNLTVPKTGEPVGAVYGVTSMLLKAIADFQPTHLAFAFDTARPTFRHERYADYKANRSAGPDDLRAQFGRVHELVRAFDIPIYEVPGYEADDILGTLSRAAAAQGIDCVIVTGDQDTFQLINDHVSVLTTRKGFSDTVLYDTASIRERFGILPRQIPDLKALTGDTSDNIKGVPGVGEKTAAKLLQRYSSVEELLDHVEEVTPPRLRDLIVAHRDQILFSKELATIACDAPVTLDLEATAVNAFDRDKLVTLFRELDFRSLANRLPTHGVGAPRAPDDPRRTQVQLSLFGNRETPTAPPTTDGAPPPIIVVTSEQLHDLARALVAADTIVLDTETDSKDPMRARLVGLALLPRPGEQAYYIPVGHVTTSVLQVVPGGAQIIDVGPAPEQLPLAAVLDALRPVMSDEMKPKIAHHGKYDLIVLAEAGLEVNGLAHDTMIAAYLLNERGLGLKELAFSALGMEMTPIETLIGKGAKQITMAEVAIPPAAAYAAADVRATGLLADHLVPKLESEGLLDLYTTVEMPLVPVLIAMERRGIALDTALLGQLSRELGEKLRELEQTIYETAGHAFNINSTTQLGTVLFEELKLPAGRRTKSGWSTDAQVLEELRGVHPIVSLVLEYRQLTKLKSTYVDALPTLINPKTGRVHTSFNQTVARTGRLSSSDPNLQNIPVRSDVGRRIRAAFVAGPGCRLISADYSQIELRILAHITRDPGLVAAFENDEDIHAATAAKIFGVPIEQVTPDQRRVAKTTNFGVIYGISDFGLAERTDMSRAEAGEFIRAYFDAYPGIRDYIERTKNDARKGRVQTLLGRFQTFPEREILSTNPTVRGAAERTAINMPIQGTAADIIKVAMIRLHAELQQLGFESALLLQVHDELLLETPARHARELADVVRTVMETAFPLSVPLKVETKYGHDWDQMQAIDA